MNPRLKLTLLGAVIVACSGVLLSGLSVAQQAEVDVSAEVKNLHGLWVSGRGSTLEVEEIDEKTGELRGWFRSSTGTDDDAKAVPVVGYVNFTERFPNAPSYGLPISFSVNWGPYGSISTWSGLVLKKDSKTTIETQWLHTRGSTQFDWDHTLAGNDVFKRPPPQ